MSGAVAAIGMVCSLALSPATCIPANARLSVRADVPRAICVLAIEETLAARTQALPIDPRSEYVKIEGCDKPSPGGLSADDAGQVAPPSFHVFTPEEIARMKQAR